jgi:putative toxin-antitoxin system antitoxin component (TIGR02293 family)
MTGTTASAKRRAAKRPLSAELSAEALLPSFTFDKIVAGIPARSIDLPQFGMVVVRVKGVRERRDRSLLDDIIHRAIPPRTFARRVKEDQPLAPHEADAIARLLRVTAFANKVLGDEDRAQRWLTKPNPALKNNIPLDMAETDVGAREVETILNRIAYGDYS